VGAFSPGTATITAKTKDGDFIATCEVVVSEPNIEIYVPTEEFVPEEQKTRPALWKNGVCQYLGDGNNYSSARCVFVSGSDVYVAGTGFNEQGVRVATVWKNGTAQYTIGDGILHSQACSLFVSGGDVYVAGIAYDYYYTNQKCNAMVWKNGEPQTLSKNDKETYATSVFVSNGDVYVTGYCWNNHVAILWKNGLEQTLNGPIMFNGNPHGYAEAVFVSGGDVYVAGFVFGLGNYSAAVLWKNGEPHYLSDGNYYDEQLYSVFVSDDGDVYAAGRVLGGDVLWTATLYKNGVAQSFDVGKHATEINSIFVLGSDVYMIGTEQDFVEDRDPAKGFWGRPLIWINGTMQGFIVPNEHYSIEGNSLFVKKKE
jgi:hypothetical protein